MFNNIKIAIGYELRNGPWGGANQFIKSFKKYFESKGAKIVFQLEENLDFIIIFSVFSGLFKFRELLKYKHRFPKVKLIHRINDCDLKRIDYQVDNLRLKFCKISDGVIFISEWLKEYYIKKGFDIKIPNAVIRNGADETIFNPQGYLPWQKNEVMRVVTHHWSYDWLKGADIYKYFDELLDDSWMRNHFKFTYIGNTPLDNKRIKKFRKKILFSNTTTIPPLNTEELGVELKKHHVYLTASRWEPGGMHHLEGACCGLPLLYIDEGGGAVETCKGFGIQFSKDAFEIGLFKMREQYDQIYQKMKIFPFKASLMNKNYDDFFCKLLTQ